MPLCSNRPEGFGPVSHIYSHTLTSCFLDTILVPLCTWLYFSALALSSLLPSRSRNGNFDAKAAARRRNCLRSSRHFDYSNPTSSAEKYSLSRTRRTGEIVYGVLLFATLAMCVIEISRLALADLGVGLLPFTLAGLVVAGCVHYSYGFGGRIRGSATLNTIFFVCLAVANCVKLAGELQEGWRARKGTKYPMSDQGTDVGVMIGLYVVLAVLEVLLR